MLPSRTALIAFALIFIAELGDKTQLTTMVLAAESRSPWQVFAGAAVALLLTSLLGVTFGETLTRMLPGSWLRTAAGLAFIAVGALLLIGERAR